MTLHGAIPPGQNHIAFNWQYADKSARESATGFTAEDNGKLARQNDDNSLWLLWYHDPATWVKIGGGKNTDVSFESGGDSNLVVPALEELLGEISFGYPGIYNIVDGCVFWLKFSVIAGASNDLNVELGDDAFTGSPKVLYEVGEDSEGLPRWNPTTDGIWEDRNAWGFQGLVDGKIYYRITNNAATSVTLNIEMRMHGRYSYVDPS